MRFRSASACYPPMREHSEDLVRNRNKLRVHSLGSSTWKRDFPLGWWRVVIYTTILFRMIFIILRDSVVNYLIFGNLVWDIVAWELKRYFRYEIIRGSLLGKQVYQKVNWHTQRVGRLSITNIYNIGFKNPRNVIILVWHMRPVFSNNW